MLFDVKYIFAILFINLTIISAEESSYAGFLNLQKFDSSQLGLFSTWSDIDDYACNCGSDKTGPAVDKIDDCCRIHKSCYNEITLRRNSCDAQKNIYSLILNDNAIKCDSNGDECEYAFCDCDREAAQCFKKYLSSLNPSLKNFSKEKCNNDVKKLSFTPPPNPVCCPAGSMQNETQDGCNLCRPGTYSPEPCYSDPTSTCSICETCIPCPRGFYCEGFGTITPIVCPAGTIVNYNKDGCNPCLAGTYGNYAGFSETDCIYCQTCNTCPPGYECPLPGTVTPTICPTGTMQAHNHTQCNSCLPGHYSDQEGLFDPHCRECQSCKTCLPGYECPNYGTVNPIICPQGTIQAQNNTQCNLCLPGTYNDQVGYSGTHCADCETCQPCIPGYFCPSFGTIVPEICPAGTMVNREKTGCNQCRPGTYSSQPGYNNPNCEECTSCLNCPENNICPGPGQTVPVPCQPGFIPNFYATECIVDLGQW